MTAIVATPELYRPAREHLRGHMEQVGFFLADFMAERDTFVLREWRPMPPEAFDIQSAYHVTLRDEIRPEIIKWAWDRGVCLVEAHSHGDEGPASFSSSDLAGFNEWIPHVRWRLRGRPYAAIVTAGDTFDAFAWINTTTEPTQVERIEVGGRIYVASARTLPHLIATKTQQHGD